jgi:diadenosine tetraphosphate (Ap4A) HIT family hydrolase
MFAIYPSYIKAHALRRVNRIWKNPEEDIAIGDGAFQGQVRFDQSHHHVIPGYPEQRSSTQDDLTTIAHGKQFVPDDFASDFYLGGGVV